MKKIIAGSIFVICTLITFYVVSIVSIDHSGLYTKLLKSISSEGDDLKAHGFKFHTAPKPYITIAFIENNGKYSASNVTIDLSFISLITFNPKISKISALNASIYNNHLAPHFFDHSRFLITLLNNKYPNIIFHVDNLSILNDLNMPTNTLNNLYFECKNHLYTIHSNTSQGELNIHINNDIKQDEQSVDLVLENALYHVHLKETYINQKLVSGALDIDVKRVLDLFSQILPDTAYFLKNLGSSNNDNVKITSPITINNNSIALNNIQIKSSTINGSGNVILAQNENTQSTVNFVFDQIDLSDHRNKTHVNSNTHNESLYASVANNLQLTNHNQNIKTAIKAKSIKLSQDNILHDFNFATTIQNGKIHVDNFYAQINDQGRIKVTGNVTQNSFRNLFEGQILLAHRDLNDLAEFITNKNDIRLEKTMPFTLISDISISAVDLSLQKMILNMSENKIIGDVSIKQIGTIPRINSNVKIESINFDKPNLPALNKLLEYTTSFFDNMKDDGYLAKYIPIRTMPFISNNHIIINTLIFNKENYQNLHATYKLSPGLINIENLYLDDGKNHIDANFQLVATGLNPEYSFKINNGNIRNDNFTVDQILGISQNISTQYDLSNIVVNLDINLEKLILNNLEIDNVSLQSSNDANTVFVINNFSFNILDGKFISNGSFAFTPFYFKLAYALNSINIAQIMPYLHEAFRFETDGGLSLSGTITSNGTSVDELFYNLHTKSTIITKGMTLPNMSIDNFIDKVNNIHYNIDNLDKDANTMLFSGSTFINDISGEFELYHGIVSTLPNSSITFHTQKASGAVSMSMNFYDYKFHDYAKAAISFYIIRNYFDAENIDKVITSLDITLSDIIFAPNKVADISKMRGILQTRTVRD